MMVSSSLQRAAVLPLLLAIALAALANSMQAEGATKTASRKAKSAAGLGSAAEKSHQERMRLKGGGAAASSSAKLSHFDHGGRADKTKKRQHTSNRHSSSLAFPPGRKAPQKRRHHHSEEEGRRRREGDDFEAQTRLFPRRHPEALLGLGQRMRRGPAVVTPMAAQTPNTPAAALGTPRAPRGQEGLPFRTTGAAASGGRSTFREMKKQQRHFSPQERRAPARRGGSSLYQRSASFTGGSASSSASALLHVRADTFPEVIEDERTFAQDFVADDGDFMLKGQIDREREQSAVQHKMVLQAEQQERARQRAVAKTKHADEETFAQNHARKLQRAQSLAAGAESELKAERSIYDGLAKEQAAALLELSRAKAGAQAVRARLASTENATLQLERRGAAVDQEERIAQAAFARTSQEAQATNARYVERSKDLEAVKVSMADLKKRATDFDQEAERLGRSLAAGAAAAVTSSSSQSTESGGDEAREEAVKTTVVATEQKEKARQAKAANDEGSKTATEATQDMMVTAKGEKDGGTSTVAASHRLGYLMILLSVLSTMLTSSSAAQ